ncbi:unnamed protein product [Auanema sp. JU1783]|nr:unnamed protein product [Auanema sp. JU1783]
MIMKSAFLLIVFVTSVHGAKRLKRDFMFVTDTNGTDAGCFADCNEKYKHDFEYSFNMNTTDFYDFPFHPIVLRYSSFLLFCRLAQQRTECYQNKCGDTMADTMFSPSNFICSFKKTLFMEVRPCLAEAEPKSFLTCDKKCQESVTKKEENDGEEPRKIYSMTEMEGYEVELDKLCTFQSCYLQCVEPILKETCPAELAAKSVDLLKSLVQWHAGDINDWHMLNDRQSQLPESCHQLAISRLVIDKTDPILQLFERY